jgi:hypothetical protein
MAEVEVTAQEELRNALWVWTQRTVVALVLFGGGILAAYFAWGDAAELRQHNKELQDQIVDLKNQRETLNTRIAREARDKEVCNRSLSDAKKAASAGQGGGTAPAGAEGAAPGSPG